ncbi:MAG TPA: OB-fold domain-containing protein [Pseudomonadales bacterium]|nr:OB-fold domain-containing protein [Pseudomonadales bacterium]HNC69491.1 OB-fold domain-containing protein [Pseudomonadales bacterium]
MKSSDAPAGRIAAQDYIVLDHEGAYLAGSRCTACNAVFLGERRVCAACGARERMVTRRLGDRGRVYSFTAVCRSFPGVPVPFVMAVVDLDDGPTLRGTLCDVEPRQVRFDMPVRVVFRDSGQRDASGAAYISFAFVPERENQS